MDENGKQFTPTMIYCFRYVNFEWNLSWLRHIAYRTAERSRAGLTPTSNQRAFDELSPIGSGRQPRS